MIAALHISLGQVAATLALVGVAIAVSLWARTGLESDVAVAVLRSFVQLTAIGYVIKAIFASSNLGFVVGPRISNSPDHCQDSVV